MDEETSEKVGYFVFGVTAIERADGQFTYRPQSITNNIPAEVAIMQMDVFLKEMKKVYHNTYRGTSPKEE